MSETFGGWAADMIDFIKAFGLKKVDLFGFSMGGLAGEYSPTEGEPGD